MYKNNMAKDINVRKDNIKTTMLPISTYSKAELKMKPQSTEVDEMDVKFILCCFQRQKLTDLSTGLHAA